MYGHEADLDFELQLTTRGKVRDEVPEEDQVRETVGEWYEQVERLEHDAELMQQRWNGPDIGSAVPRTVPEPRWNGLGTADPRTDIILGKKEKR